VRIPTSSTASSAPAGTTAAAGPPWAHSVNLALGIWLFISAFIWPHVQPLKANTWILGIIISVVSVIAMRNNSVRGVNTVAAAWLFFSSLAMTHISRGTVWNNVLVAIAVFVLSLVPSHRGYRQRAHA
jgi:hypothetical protein